MHSSQGWWGFQFQCLTYRAWCLFILLCSHFPVFVRWPCSHDEYMQRCDTSFLGFHSNTFFDVLYSTELCGLLMICSETFLHPILQIVLPRGLILGYVSIPITSPDFTEMFLLDERASQTKQWYAHLVGSQSV